MLLTFSSLPSDQSNGLTTDSFIEAEQKFLQDLKHNIIVTQSRRIDQRASAEDNVWPTNISGLNANNASSAREFRRFPPKQHQISPNPPVQSKTLARNPDTHIHVNQTKKPQQSHVANINQSSSDIIRPRDVAPKLDISTASNVVSSSSNPRRKLSGRSCTVDVSSRPDMTHVLANAEVSNKLKQQLEGNHELEQKQLSERERHYQSHLASQNRPIMNRSANANNNSNGNSSRTMQSVISSNPRAAAVTRIRKRSASADLANTPDVIASLKALQPSKGTNKSHIGTNPNPGARAKPLPKPSNYANSNSQPSSPRQNQSANQQPVSPKTIPVDLSDNQLQNSTSFQSASERPSGSLGANDNKSNNNTNSLFLRPGEREFSTLFYTVKESFMLLLRLVATFVKTLEVKVIIELGMNSFFRLCVCLFVCLID
jgi:hypothetical protein